MQSMLPGTKKRQVVQLAKQRSLILGAIGTGPEMGLYRRSKRRSAALCFNNLGLHRPQERITGHR